MCWFSNCSILNLYSQFSQRNFLLHESSCVVLAIILYCTHIHKYHSHIQLSLYDTSCVALVIILFRTYFHSQFFTLHTFFVLSDTMCWLSGVFILNLYSQFSQPNFRCMSHHVLFQRLFCFALIVTNITGIFSYCVIHPVSFQLVLKCGFIFTLLTFFVIRDIMCWFSGCSILNLYSQFSQGNFLHCIRFLFYQTPCVG